MAILVDYFCGACRSLTELWSGTPVLAEQPCSTCGGTSRRQYGVTLLGRGQSGLARPDATACGQAPAVPGTCTLVPSASRLLQAHLQRDKRGIERELASQARAVERGDLDPSGPLVASLHQSSTPDPATTSRSGSSRSAAAAT